MVLERFDAYNKKSKKCAARESNPGHSVGNAICYHYTSGASQLLITAALHVS